MMYESGKKWVSIDWPVASYFIAHAPTRAYTFKCSA